MNNSHFNSMEDLVFNRSFREWVLTPATAEAAFWENWMSNNPGMAETVNQSKAIIYALQFNLKGLSDESINHEIRKILQMLDADEEPSKELDAAEENDRLRVSSKKLFLWLSAPAAAFLMITAFILFRDKLGKDTPAGYESFLAQRKVNTVEQVNNAAFPLKVILPDGSKVYLEKNSKVSYSQNFSGSKREVFLSGAAFFEVKKNALSPFLVYTSSIVTKVLGTSFRISAYPADKKAVITVKTGKVSVFKAQNFDQAAAKGTAPDGIVLTPNQEVIYTRESNELNKTLTEQPEAIAVPSRKAFVFDATPVRLVFKAMQDTYDIRIIYDEDLMAGCSLSATMGEESFYEKLNLICKALNASYEMIDGQIVIVSKGCNPAH